MSNQVAFETAIDRACAAQSNELLPKLAPSPEELQRQKRQVEARVNAHFKGLG